MLMIHCFSGRCKKNFTVAMDTIETFGKYSGLFTNWSKSILLPVEDKEHN